MREAMLIPEPLYQEIIKVMPIPCVDLVVLNKQGAILMLKRKNEPAKDEWWFPGGRIHFMESRRDAAIRKLQEECGLKGEIINEVGTYDLILGSSHGITTVFQMSVDDNEVIFDGQSEEYRWDSGASWIKTASSPFLQDVIHKLLL